MDIYNGAVRTTEAPDEEIKSFLKEDQFDHPEVDISALDDLENFNI